MVYGFDTVIFNVGGRMFEVLRQTIDNYPSTLLPCLAGDIGTDLSSPVFVDANPDRFAHILDWYRYGQMFMPDGPEVQAMLRDARFYLLPDVITINGVSFHVGKDVPLRSYDAVMKDVATSWPGFQEYLDRIVTEADQTVARAVQHSKFTQHDDGNCNKEDLTSVVFHSVPLTISMPHIGQFADASFPRREHFWNDETNICNKYRLQALIHELTKRGFVCSVQADQDGGLSLSVGLRRPSNQEVKIWQNGIKYSKTASILSPVPEEGGGFMSSSY